jgi:hypothetical protein
MLKEHQTKLLKEVVTKRCPQLLAHVESGDLAGLAHAERQTVMNALSDEFTASGIGKDWEPTQRGLQLEELLDIVNRANLKNRWRLTGLFRPPWHP